MDTKAILVREWTAALSALALLYFVAVAQYDAWKEQRQGRAKAERELGLATQTGPEVWLDFQNSASFSGFTVENRGNNLDASHISVDPFETRTYRVTPSARARLRHGDTQALGS